MRWQPECWTSVHWTDNPNTSRHLRPMKNTVESHGTRPERSFSHRPISNARVASLRNQRRVLTALLAMTACLAAPVGRALSETELAAITKIIANAPTAELPPKSAEIVAKARPSDKEATAVAVVRAAIARRPASAVSVV